MAPYARAKTLSTFCFTSPNGSFFRMRFADFLPGSQRNVDGESTVRILQRVRASFHPPCCWIGQHLYFNRFFAQCPPVRGGLSVGREHFDSRDKRSSIWQWRK